MSWTILSSVFDFFPLYAPLLKKILKIDKNENNTVRVLYNTYNSI